MNSTRRLKKILQKFIQRIDEEGTICNLPDEAKATSAPKSGKEYTRESLTNVPHEHRHKNPHRNTSELSSATCKKRVIPHSPMLWTPGMQRRFDSGKSVIVTFHGNPRKEREAHGSVNRCRKSMSKTPTSACDEPSANLGRKESSLTGGRAPTE